ncbi:hypothetical protein [Actinoplanes sp. NPDC051411]|uniref:hypothetical protein n=1 Tax=Actinoplanes sp. NPDC051411 TaxID=3155522 RepID=UPI0034346F71
MPGFFVGVGVVALVASAVGHRLSLGVATAGILVLCAIVLAAAGPGRRSSRSRPGSNVRVRRGLGLLAAIVMIASLGTLIGTLAAGGSGFTAFFVVVALAVGYTVIAVSRRRA